MEMGYLFKLSLLLTFGSIICQKCDNGWQRFGDKCFFARKYPVKYHELEAICKQYSASTVSIHSEQENKFLKKVAASGMFWLGGYRVTRGQKRFAWKDGTPFNYYNWSPSEPDSINEVSTECISAYVGKLVFWYDDNCDNEHFPLCQKPAEDVHSMIITETRARNKENDNSMINELETKINQLNLTLQKALSTINEMSTNFTNKEMELKRNINLLNNSLQKVDTTFGDEINDIYTDIATIARVFNNILSIPESYNNTRAQSRKVLKQEDDIAYESCFTANITGETVTKCYYYEKFRVTYEEANALCEQMDRNLVVVMNKFENDLIAGKVIHNEHYWTAGKRIIPGMNIFSWSNGNKLEYTNWSEGEPNTGINNDCITLKHGEWFASDCHDKHSIICLKVKASSDYLNKQSGTSLISEHSIHLNEFTKFQRSFDNLKLKEGMLKKALSDVMNGNYFGSPTNQTTARRRKFN